MFKIFEETESNVRSYCRKFPTEFSLAQNAILTDINGSRYIDFFAGAGAMNYGHNNPFIKSAVLEYLKDKDMVKGNLIGNKSKGTNASLPINNYARTLIRNWLILPKPIIETVDGEDVETTIYNLNFIRNRALLQELSQWNADGNFDRVSALGMLMLLREDKMITFGGSPEKAKEVPTDYLGNDPFFTNNYDNRYRFN